VSRAGSVAAKLAEAGILGLLASFALASCGGGDGEAIVTGTVTRALPTTSAATETEAAPAETAEAAPPAVVT
jgi:hypothetical protein